MKEQAKKAVAHRIEVMGKTVPTLAVVALLLVGTGTAALLTSYGTVQGTSDVTQAIVFGDEGTEEGTTTLTEFSGGQVAGSTIVDEVNLTNNRNETVEVRFNSSQEGPEGQSGDVAGLDTGFIATRGFVGEEIQEGTEDEAYVDYVVDQETEGDYPAALLKVNKETDEGATSAGIKFDVEGELDETNEVSVSFRPGADHVKDNGNQKAAPDWILYYVTATSNVTNQDDQYENITEGESYLVGDFAVNDTDGDGEFTGTGLDFDGDSSNVLAFEAGTFNQVKPQDLVGNASIDQLKLATGTQGDTANSELYIYDVEYNGDSLMRSIPHVSEAPVSYTVPPGYTNVFTVNELAINAYPGDYTVTAEALPLSDQVPE